MSIHKPVLLKETIDGLNLKLGAVVVDATLGGGGHASEMLEKIGKRGRLIAIDSDEVAIERFKPKAGKIFLAKGNFADLKNILGDLGITTADAILADLGYSTDQMEDERIGMSFQKDAKLDMRLDRDAKMTAWEIVNNRGQDYLEKIIREYGEERFAKNIARKITEYRKNKKIETTKELAGVVESAIPERYRYKKNPCLPAGRNPATKTFQALRIEVNQELENLEKFIPQAIETLTKGGRLGIITFHSLEDRIVKNMFRTQARGCLCPRDFPECRCGHAAKVKIITRKPIVPSDWETKNNPKSRSAKLRICEKI